LTSESADGRRFVAALNFEAKTRRHDLLERTPGALLPTWQLCSQLPDTDLETGAPMDASKFASRWQRKAADVLTALIKKHEGELRELQGYWIRGEGEVHDFLFDPQFALTQSDYLMCKGMAKGLGTSRFQRDYEIMWGWHRQGRGHCDMGKGEQLVVGSKGKGKVQASEEGGREYVFHNRVLQLHHDRSWQYRSGIAISLPHLFLSLGLDYTAADLYGYFNTLQPLCVKRPHAWSHPVRQEAAHQRWKSSMGRGRGHGFGR